MLVVARDLLKGDFGIVRCRTTCSASWATEKGLHLIRALSIQERGSIRWPTYSPQHCQRNALLVMCLMLVVYIPPVVPGVA